MCGADGNGVSYSCFLWTRPQRDLAVNHRGSSVKQVTAGLVGSVGEE